MHLASSALALLIRGNAICNTGRRHDVLGWRLIRLPWRRGSGQHDNAIGCCSVIICFGWVYYQPMLLVPVSTMLCRLARHHLSSETRLQRQQIFGICGVAGNDDGMCCYYWRSLPRT